MARPRVCYYCGRRATTQEHVPPRLMFRAFDCDSITVPACAQHNTEKSGSDQAIVHGLLLTLEQSMGAWPRSEEVTRALEAAERGFSSTKRNAFPAPLLDDPDGKYAGLPDVGFVRPCVGASDWIRQLTAALVYDGAQAFDSTIRWAEVAPFSPSLIGCEEPTPLPPNVVLGIFARNRQVEDVLNTHEWHEGWSAKPRPYPSAIFKFLVAFTGAEVLFRYRFYDTFDWYIAFRASRRTTRALRGRVKRL